MAKRKRPARTATPAASPTPQQTAAEPAGEVVARQVDAAERLEITPRQLRNWMGQPGFPDCSKGYPIGAIEDWRDQRQLKGSEDGAAIQRLRRELLEERVRQERCRAEALERAEQIAAGNVLPRDEYETWLAELIAISRDRLTAIPKELCRCVPKTHHRRLQTEGRAAVDRVLDELARRIEEGPR